MKPSLYIHIPFCHRKCFYCSFVVSIGQEKRVDSYLDCLAREAESYQGTEISTIYLGGGTPTYLNCDQLKRLAQIIEENFKYRKGTEWTIEANPEGVDLAKLNLLKSLGINRISLGIQSLNSQYLKYLGRNHTSALAVKTFKAIREEGFDNVSIDFMYSFPKQTMAELQEDLKNVTQLNSEHISVYMLTIEEPSRFYAQKMPLKDDQIQAQEYTRVIEILADAGFKQYEISNFAKPGKESKHNLNYWQGGNYIGLGVGAHSHRDGKRFSNVSEFMPYMEMIQLKKDTHENIEELSAHQRFIEKLLFGLRMNEGVKVKTLEKEFDCPLDQEREVKLKEFTHQEFLRWDNEKLKVTDKGRLVLDELCSRLI